MVVAVIIPADRVAVAAGEVVRPVKEAGVLLCRWPRAAVGAEVAVARVSGVDGEAVGRRWPRLVHRCMGRAAGAGGPAGWAT